MTRISIISLCLLGTASISATAYAETVREVNLPEPACHVKTVKEDRGTILVYLDDQRMVDAFDVVGENGKSETSKFLVAMGNSAPPQMPDAAKWAPYLRMQHGSTFSLISAGKLECLGRMVKRDGKLGLAIEMPTKHTKAEMNISAAFIPAEHPMETIGSGENLPTSATSDNALFHVKTDSYDFAYHFPNAVLLYPKLANWLDSFAIEGLFKIKDENNPENEEYSTREGSLRDGKNPTQYRSNVIWKIAGENPRFLSLSAEEDGYFGGVHGEFGAKALLWDKQTENKIDDPALLFSGGLSFLRTKYCAALTQEWISNAGDAAVVDSRGKYRGKWDCPELYRLSISFSGDPGAPFNAIHLRADPYVAGPYEDGFVDVTLPIDQADLQNIKPEYRAAFQAAGRNGDDQ